MRVDASNVAIRGGNSPGSSERGMGGCFYGVGLIGINYAPKAKKVNFHFNLVLLMTSCIISIKTEYVLFKAYGVDVWLTANHLGHSKF